MATSLKLRYRSIEQFLGHYRQLKEGRIFVPTEMPLPADTPLRLVLKIPGISRRVELEALVLESVDPRKSEAPATAWGMVIGVRAEPGSALEALGRELEAVPGQAAPSGRPADSAIEPAPGPDPEPEAAAAEGQGPGEAVLPMPWIRRAVAQEEAALENEAPAHAPHAPTGKKDLTPGERARIKPVGDFVMDLTKAMLRTGYYAPDHPGSRNAKRGMYEAFQNSLGASPELVITLEETREKTDFLVSGVLEEPVNVRTLVGAGMVELFVPKLRDFFNRKGLVSFAVKRAITAEHFDAFVDVMSDPAVERRELGNVGALLTQAMVDRAITGISAVFMDDIIALEKNLPWRVEMAIQRLAKDLKVLPMFQAKSDAAIKEMKLQIIQDILRPLKHPEFLKDLIVNCYIIARHVKNVDEEDIEQVIIDAFPLDKLLATSHSIFDEMHRMREISAQDPNNDSVKQRFAAVRRILKHVSRRLVFADVRGAQRFLEQLHANGILAFHELPPEVQYLVNTRKMAKDVAVHVKQYVQRMLKPDSAADAVVLLKCFQRVIPTLIEQGDARTVLWLARATAKAAAAAAGLPPDPLPVLFGERTRELQAAFEGADGRQRIVIEEILKILGPLGVAILCHVLADSDSREARKAALEALTRAGALTREWVLTVLEDPLQKWYLKRNALMLLRHTAEGPRDAEAARKLTAHPHARVRDEALSTTFALDARDAEKLAVKALDDPDEKIRWRAANALAELSPLSPDVMGRLMERILAEPPPEKDQAARHLQTTVQILRSVGNMKELKDPGAVEDAVLGVALRAAGQRKGLLKRLRKSDDPEQAAVLAAALTALGAIGSARSQDLLARLAGSRNPQAEAATQALKALNTRLTAPAAEQGAGGNA